MVALYLIWSPDSGFENPTLSRQWRKFWYSRTSRECWKFGLTASQKWIFK